MPSEVDKILKHKIYLQSQEHWDTYLMDICHVVATNSKCLSRKIGSILVRDHSIISTGYNGPPRGTTHCSERMQTYDSKDPFWQEYGNKEIKDLYTCPRRLLGYASGQGLHLCPAAHAERNCISNAAMHGVYTKGSTCYLNAEAPCKDCMASLINAGIKHIVCLRKEAYDPISNILAKEAQVLIREV